MMSDQPDNLNDLLIPFGLTSEESEIYLLLLQKGQMSALHLSRELHLARTKVYRLLDKLIAKSLVAQRLGDLGKKFEAASPRQLDLLVTQKEHELEILKKSKDLIYSQLGNLNIINKEKSRVLYYSGVEGLKQVTWNSLKAKKELLIMELSSMSAFLDYGFCEKVRREFLERGVRTRELTNLKKMPAWTKITEFVKRYWSCRYLDPKELRIKFELLIYNDVFAMYSYKNNDIFCVEVYNQDLADTQRELFDFLWLHAQKTKLINTEGAAEVVRK